MNIVYVARHGQANSNDDEGAITHALRQLGHRVDCVDENARWSSDDRIRLTESWNREYHLLLFHKWDNAEMLSRVMIPKVFWWFDLVNWPADPSLGSRSRARVQWMERVIPLVNLGFLSDGDWVAHNDKLVTLRQGADERVAGRGDAKSNGWESDPVDVLFCGIARGGGRERESFVEEMKQEYGQRFRHIPAGWHGRRLADLIAHAKVVVAPDSPVTDRYWSNRVYLMMGFGAFLIHPLCEDLCRDYRHNEEIVYYSSRGNLHSHIRYALANPEFRARVSEAGLQRTLAQHTYRHRCEVLINTIKERLSVQ